MIEVDVGERLTHQDLATDDVVVPQIHGCARCGKHHGQTVFERMERPMVSDDATLTHWAACPNNGQPILFGVQTLRALYDPE